MDKSFIKLFMDIQIWVMNHIGQLYYWGAVMLVLNTTIYYYSRYINHISIIPYWILTLFLYYASWKIIIR
jgi:hypothetical protein